eukprot:scaffold222462_cov30-Tisochrysis_lutea.AAC.1
MRAAAKIEIATAYATAQRTRKALFVSARLSSLGRQYASWQVSIAPVIAMSCPTQLNANIQYSLVAG